MPNTYNKEIISRYKQHEKLLDKQKKAGRAAAKRGDILGTARSAIKASKLTKSMDKLGSAYVSPKPYTKKNYN